jgi:hypothetical protein
MRPCAPLPLAALLLAGCETAFVGTPPSGRYELASVNGRALPFDRGSLPGGPSETCRNLLQSGHLTMDSIARRFEIYSQSRNSCTGQQLPEMSVSGSYLRSAGRLTLETPDPGGSMRRWRAYESGRAITVQFGDERLLFRRAPR